MLFDPYSQSSLCKEEKQSARLILFDSLQIFSILFNCMWSIVYWHPIHCTTSLILTLTSCNPSSCLVLPPTNCLLFSTSLIFLGLLPSFFPSTHTKFSFYLLIPYSYHKTIFNKLHCNVPILEGVLADTLHRFGVIFFPTSTHCIWWKLKGSQREISMILSLLP
jgi:hypothetical protein